MHKSGLTDKQLLCLQKQTATNIRDYNRVLKKKERKTDEHSRCTFVAPMLTHDVTQLSLSVVEKWAIFKSSYYYF